jgi:hypothetical protein
VQFISLGYSRQSTNILAIWGLLGTIIFGVIYYQKISSVDIDGSPSGSS